MKLCKFLIDNRLEACDFHSTDKLKYLPHMLRVLIYVLGSLHQLTQYHVSNKVGSPTRQFVLLDLYKTLPCPWFLARIRHQSIRLGIRLAWSLSGLEAAAADSDDDDDILE